MESGQQSKTAQYALIQGLYWMSFCIIFAYASVYLLDKGFSNTAIGLLVGISGTISAVLQPLVGGMAGDGPGKVPLKRMIMSGCALMVLVGLSLFLVSGNQMLTLVCYGMAITVLQVLTSLVYSLGMVCINRGERLDFGLARGLGSLAYAGISYVAGFMVASVGTEFIPASIAGLYGLMLAAVFFFQAGEMQVPALGRLTGDRSEAGAGGNAAAAGTVGNAATGAGDAAGTEGKWKSDENYQNEDKGETQNNQQEVTFFKRYPRFLMLLLGATLVFVSHNMLNNFAFQIMESKGGGSSAMGTAIALAAASELPTMFLFGWMVKKVRCDIWLKISGLFFLIKAAATVLVSSVAGMYVIQGLQMFGFALFVVASVYYVNMIMKDKDRTRGQAFMTMTNTLGGVLGSSFGGALIDGFGIHTMLLVSTVVAAAGMVLMSGAVKQRMTDRG